MVERWKERPGPARFLLGRGSRLWVLAGLAGDGGRAVPVWLVGAGGGTNGFRRWLSVGFCGVVLYAAEKVNAVGIAEVELFVRRVDRRRESRL